VDSEIVYSPVDSEIVYSPVDSEIVYSPVDSEIVYSPLVFEIVDNCRELLSLLNKLILRYLESAVTESLAEPVS
jgi:hypothetical protein